MSSSTRVLCAVTHFALSKNLMAEALLAGAGACIASAGEKG